MIRGRGSWRGRGAAIIVTVILAVGLWHTARGAWIYVKAALAQQLLQRAWAEAAAGAVGVRPWPGADFSPVARIEAPRHGADVIVLSGVSGRTLAFGPGHAPDTAVPGEPGTAIVTGHRDTHFRFLRRLRIDDELLVDTPGRPRARFVVREAAVVDARVAAIRGSAAAALVLITCYPFDAVTPGGPLRYVVIADRADR